MTTRSSLPIATYSSNSWSTSSLGGMACAPLSCQSHSRMSPAAAAPRAYHFLGALLSQAEALTALFTPTVNSFKRINAAPPVSGATWSPNAISYGANNRTHMVRIPEPGRFELRLMDGAANPYLLQAGILAGGLDALARRVDPGERLAFQMYGAGAAPAGIAPL